MVRAIATPHETGAKYIHEFKIPLGDDYELVQAALSVGHDATPAQRAQLQRLCRKYPDSFALANHAALNQGIVGPFPPATGRDFLAVANHLRNRELDVMEVGGDAIVETGGHVHRMFTEIGQGLGYLAIDKGGSRERNVVRTMQFIADSVLVLEMSQQDYEGLLPALEPRNEQLLLEADRAGLPTPTRVYGYVNPRPLA